MTDKSKPKIAGYKPIKQEVEPGIYAICQCGWSSNQPFCDGSHRETSDLRPIMITVEQPQKFSFCTCKHSRNFPFCDTTHKLLLKNLEDNIASRFP
jgi:CDGSH-type Zn-finger protein